MIRKIIFFFVILVFTITSCSKPNRVVITSHDNQMVVSEIATITSEPFEESEIRKIKLFVNGVAQSVFDDSEPWVLKWNTIDLDDNSNHYLNILAYGPEGDSSFSDTLYLTVDNSISYPGKVAISNITLKEKGFYIVWDKSQDNDFSKYILEKGSKKTLSDAKVIYESNIITDNQYRDSKVNPLKYQYYRISVEDYVGYKTKGDVFSSNLEKVPSSINVKNVQYNSDEMTVSWDKSSDSDFAYYSLYGASSLNGKKKRVTKISSKNSNSYTIRDFNPLIENWFWIEVTDKHGYKSIGAGKSNSIDEFPEVTEIIEVTYNKTELAISWNPNIDNDFKSYEIFMSNKISKDRSLGIIEDQSRNTLKLFNFDPTIINNYKIITTDIWGQKSESSPISNKIDKAPSQVSIKSLKFDGKGLSFEWTKSNEDNFNKYYICHTHDLGAVPDTVAVYDNQNITSHKLVSGFNPNLDNWVWVIVADSRKQSSISPPQVLKNNPPKKSSLSLVIDENENLNVNWIKNTDDDFTKYLLYHSQNPDMKNKSLIFESSKQFQNSYNFLVEDHSRINYFQLVVEDVFGVQAKSDYIAGVPTDLQVLLDIVLDNNLNVIPTELGTQIWENGRLTELSIGKWSDGGGIQIHTLPGNIGDLANLKNLWLSNNNLSQFPDSFAKLSKLEILELRSNKFLEVSQILTSLPKLKYLGLSYNEIIEIPEWITAFHTMEKLFLSHNKLAEIPESICGLSLNYKEMGNSFLSQNHLCVQFLLPDCIENQVGDQNCSNQ